MSEINKDLVEMTKINNGTPFSAIWVYWETEIHYSIIDENASEILIRTPNKLLNGNKVYRISGMTASGLGIGTYSIGTYSIGTSSVGTYSIEVMKPGYIHSVHDDDGVMSNGHYRIPNNKEIEIEWTTDVNHLRPGINPIRPGGYGVYANYGELVRRDTDGDDYIFIDIDDNNGDDNNPWAGTC